MFDLIARIDVGALLALGGAIGTVAVGIAAALLGHQKAPATEGDGSATTIGIERSVADVRDDIGEMRDDVRGVAADLREVRGSVQRLEVITGRLDARGEG